MILLLFSLLLIWDCNGAASIKLSPKEITLPETGITIEYVTHGTSRNCPPILALHGFGDSWFSYYLLIQDLPDFRIYSISLPCFGESTKDEVISSSYDSVASVVNEFMDELNIDSAYIIGHSTSSMLAPRLALLYPDRVEGIILLGPIGTLALNPDLLALLDSITAAGQAYGLLPDDSFPEEFVRESQGSNTQLDLIPEWFFNRTVEDTLKVPFKCWIAGATEMRDFNQLDQLPQLELPFLIIYGDLDFVAWDAETGGPEALVLNVPDVTLYKLHNLGHAPHWEDPQKTANIIRTFLRSIK